MPNSTTTLKEIFAAALEFEPGVQRSDYLAAACGEDADLRAEVEGLLAAHVRADGFLSRAESGRQATILVPSETEQPGTQIGPYKLLQQIGEGGFGVVYMAEQTRPVRRKVALKIIKPGMDSKEVIARFEAERQALAMMDHPNVARVLDAGTTDGGRPFFVMELVHGVPITEFCDENRLSTRQRLELFVGVCRAVQHAHQKGIIHRDLKPTNILVTMSDARPMPKVIDFGIAKALSQQLTEKTLFTAYGQMVGTPLYMSPEQAQFTAEDVDTRSDVYALGVLLYELLTGSTPFDRETLQKSGFDEMRRIIREVDPPRPSARISTLQAAALSTVCDRRQNDTRHLSRSLRGELDWIVMKALEKDRSRRYESASALAQDIQRYLGDEPVEACPPSVKYQLQKFARRHKRLLTTTVLLAATLLLAVGVSLSYAIQADREKEKSNENFAAALDAIDKLLEHASSPELAEIPQAQPIRKKILLDALDFYGQFSQKTGDSPQIRSRAAATWGDLAYLSGELKELDLAEQAYQEALSQAELLAQEFPDQHEHQAQRCRAANEFGQFLTHHRRDYESATFYFERAIALAERQIPTEPEHADEWKRYKMFALRGLTDVARSSQDREAQLEYATEAYELTQQLQSKTIGDDLYSCYNMAKALKASEPDAADQYFRDAIKHSRRWTTSNATRRELVARVYLDNNAFLFFQDRDPKLAAEVIADALELSEHLVTDFPNISAYEERLQRSQEQLLDFVNAADLPPETALPLSDKCLEISPNHVQAHQLRATLLSRGTDPISALTEAIEQFPNQSSYYEARGMLLLESMQYDAALADFVAAFQASESPKHLGYRIAEASRELNRGGHPEEALALAEFAQQQGANNHMLDMALGEAKLRLGRPEEALAHFDASIEKKPAQIAWRRKRKAEAHYALGRYDEAVADLRTAYEEDPDDESTVRWMWPHSVLECPDEKYREGRFALIAKAVREHPDEPDYLVSSAGMHVLQGDLNAARLDFDKAMQLAEPDDVDWLREDYLGCLMVMDMTEEAVAVLSEAIDSDEENPSHYLTRGMLQFRVRNYDSALTDFQTALQLDERFCNNVAWKTVREPIDSAPLTKAALHWARRAVELDPDSPTVLNTLGVCQYRNGDWQAAIDTLEQAQQRGGCGSFDTFFLAMAHQQLGLDGEAHRWLDEALAWMTQHEPNNAELIDIRTEAVSLIELRSHDESLSSEVPPPPPSSSPVSMH